MLTGYGYEPHYVTGHNPAAMHPLMARTLDTVLDQIAAIQQAARSNGLAGR